MNKKELVTDNIRDTHWLGTVVDNKDPDNFGKCKVKVFGKFDLLDDESIPWATPMNRNNVGSHYLPHIGDVVSVRFDNGNIYHPEYWFQINQNKELKDEVLDSSGEPDNVVSLVYDAKRNIRIYQSDVDGLVIAHGKDGKDSEPLIRLSDDGKIFLYAANIYIATPEGDDFNDMGNTSQPAVRGGSLEAWLDSLCDWAENHIHPTGVGPSGPAKALPPTTINIPDLRSRHPIYQQDSKSTNANE
jgi:hypothetical protein